MAPCAGNRSTPVPQAPPASSLRSSAPASGHPADACYRFRLHVSWPQTLSLSLLGRVCSLLPSGELTVKVSRELRQSLVASLLVSLSPVPSQVSAILMVLETWSQGHKNSPSRRWFPQPLRGVSQGGSRSPLRGGRGAPRARAPAGAPARAPRAGPRARGGRGGPAGPPRPFWGFSRVWPILAILGGFRASCTTFSTRKWGFLGSLGYTPYRGGIPILSQKPKKTEIPFCPDWESY